MAGFFGGTKGVSLDIGQNLADSLLQFPITFQLFWCSINFHTVFSSLRNEWISSADQSGEYVRPSGVIDGRFIPKKSLSYTSFSRGDRKLCISILSLKVHLESVQVYLSDL